MQFSKKFVILSRNFEKKKQKKTVKLQGLISHA